MSKQTPAPTKDSQELMRAVQNKNFLLKQFSQQRVLLEEKKNLKRRSEFTLKELEPIEDEAVTYRAIGRMFLKDSLPDVRIEIQTIIDETAQEIQKLEKTVEQLDQRVRESESDVREMLAQQQQTNVVAK